LKVKTEQILPEILMESVKKISFNWHGSATSPPAKPAIVNRFIREWFNSSQKSTTAPTMTSIKIWDTAAQAQDRSLIPVDFRSAGPASLSPIAVPDYRRKEPGNVSLGWRFGRLCPAKSPGCENNRRRFHEKVSFRGIVTSFVPGSAEQCRPERRPLRGEGRKRRPCGRTADPRKVGALAQSPAWAAIDFAGRFCILDERE
jgi:hypothetical protein